MIRDTVCTRDADVCKVKGLRTHKYVEGCEGEGGDGPVLVWVRRFCSTRA